jgi:hypothetical protein
MRAGDFHRALPGPVRAAVQYEQNLIVLGRDVRLHREG